LSISGSAARAGAMINEQKTANVKTVHHARRRILASPIFCAGVRPVSVSVQPTKKISYAV
jgi:hypothetical protein